MPGASRPRPQWFSGQWRDYITRPCPHAPVPFHISFTRSGRLHGVGLYILLKRQVHALSRQGHQPPSVAFSR